ncbi:MAG TPA: hypothetical protein VMI56_18770 [Reyranella sp.]|nr:hypothetical protein [Reyranella sp.]
MKSMLLRSLAVLLVLAPFAPAEAQWVFVARKAAQRIHRMAVENEEGKTRHEFVTVILEAPADRVFSVALDTVSKNPKARLLMTDPGGRRLQAVEGDRMATLNVVALNDEVSELMIAANSPSNEPPAASRVIATVMRLCEQMNKKCTVE